MVFRFLYCIGLCYWPSLKIYQRGVPLSDEGLHFPCVWQVPGPAKGGVHEEGGGEEEEAAAEEAAGLITLPPHPHHIPPPSGPVISSQWDSLPPLLSSTATGWTGIHNMRCHCINDAETEAEIEHLYCQRLRLSPHSEMSTPKTQASRTVRLSAQ